MQRPPFIHVTLKHGLTINLKANKKRDGLSAKSIKLII
jgi:hypothetical protein